MVPGAAKLRRVKRRARAPARHHLTRIRHPKLRWAVAIQVGHASCVLAVAGSSVCPQPHGHIVTVHQADVIEILVTRGRTYRELRQGNWGCAAPEAF